MDAIQNWFGLHVERFGNTPVPVLLLDWDAPEMLVAFDALLHLLHGKKLRRWHAPDLRRTVRFDHPVFHTQGIGVSLRWSEDTERLDLTVRVPALAEYARMHLPREMLPARVHDAFVQGAWMDRATEPWFRWKAAYQMAGFFLVAHAQHVGNGGWALKYMFDAPVFLLDDLLFVELGDHRMIEARTRDARNTLMGDDGK